MNTITMGFSFSLCPCIHSGNGDYFFFFSLLWLHSQGIGPVPFPLPPSERMSTELQGCRGVWKGRGVKSRCSRAFGMQAGAWGEQLLWCLHQTEQEEQGVPSPAAERGDQVQDRESNGGLREGISSEGRACVDPTYCLLLPGFSRLSSESHPAGMEVLCSCERWEPGGDPGSGSTECPWKTAPGWALGMFWGTKDGGFSLDPLLRCDRR